MKNDFYTDKSCGVMLGATLGDALGAPVEGLKPAHIKTLFKILDDYVPVEKLLKKGIRHYRQAGLYTDDTQQMLAVCDAIIAKENFSTDDIAQIFIEMCKDDTAGGFGVFRGTGRFFRYTMNDLLAAIPWERVPGNTAGCMAAVRIPAVAIKFSDDPVRLITAVINASLVTHKDPIGISVAVMQAFLIRGLLPLSAGEPFDAQALLADCKTYCAQAEKMLASQYKHLISASHPDGIYAVSSMIDRFAQLLNGKNPGAVDEYILDYASHFASMPIQKLTVPFSLTLVPLAIRIFLFNTASFDEPIITAINSGGDTDTLATLTGALAGAYWGMKSIPNKWLKGLINMNQIKLRAEILAGGKKNADIKPICEMEKQLTLHESQQAQKYRNDSQHKKTPKPRQPRPSQQVALPENELCSSVPKKVDKAARRDFERQKAMNKKERRKNKIL